MTFFKLALLGYPIAHSLSPRMHAAALRATGLEGEYRALEVAPGQLAATMRALPSQGYRGVNVTIPHKQAVMACMDSLSDAARAIGAVNTVVIEAGKLVGHNTDASGFMRALQDAQVEPVDKTVLVLGAGGAARAVVYALRQAGACVLVWNRTRERARQLADAFGAQFCDEVRFPLDMLVNATPVGTAPQSDTYPVALPARMDGSVVYDLVYNPRETAFLREAHRRGAQTIGGIEMLIQQGAEAFRLWTGCEPPLHSMREALAGN